MRREWAVCAGLVAITLAVYVQVCTFDFIEVYDDGMYVVNNQHVKRALTWENTAWAFSTNDAGNWHPVTWFSHMLDVQLFGLRSGAHHLVNVGIHAVNAVLLFLVLRRMTGAMWQSATVAALFAVHPLHVESVAWIAERKDVLSTLLGLLALAAYAGYVRRPGLARYSLVFVLLALGLMAKPMLVTFPFVLLLLDYWPLARLEQATAEPRPENTRDQAVGGAATSPRAWRVAMRLVVEKLPLMALAGVFSVVTFIVQRRSGAMSLMERIPLGARVENALTSYLAYIGKAIWPVNLAVLYPFDPDQELGRAVLAGILLGAISAAVIWAARSGRRYLAVGWFWYVGTLVPVIGLVQVGEQAMADRYMYLPATGLFIMAVWGVADLLADRPYHRVALTAAGAAVIAACLLLTGRQLRYWHDSGTLLEHAVEVVPDNRIAHNDLGVYYLRQQNFDAVVEHSNAVLERHPDDAAAHRHLAVVCMARKQLDEALEHLEIAIRSFPKDYAAQYQYAAVLWSKGDSLKSIRHLEESIRLKPDMPETRATLAQICQAMGRLDEAAYQWQEVLRLQPGNSTAVRELATILVRQEKPAQAVQMLQQHLFAEPTDVAARRVLAKALSANGQAQEAAQQLQEAVRQESGRVGVGENAKSPHREGAGVAGK
jgi:protein O-mannosyl-transferase